MPIRSAFFESTGGDRRYTADRWAQVFAGIITEGYVPGIGNQLQVLESVPPAMTVRIPTGIAFIQGRYAEVYTTAVTLTIAAANATQYRKDLVVLRLDLSAGVRDVVAAVKTGALAATSAAAVVPALQRDATIYEVGLASVLVAPADTAIQQAEITDLRDNVAYMGRSSYPDLVAHKAAATLDHPDGSVTLAKMANASVNAAKMVAGAVVAHLGYTPVNKAGDFLAGAYSIVNTVAGQMALSLQQTQATGYALGILNGAGNAWNVLISNATIILNLPVTSGGTITAPQFISNAAGGTPPITVNSTTLVPNLNAGYLGNQPIAYFASASGLTTETNNRVAADNAEATARANAIAAINSVPSGMIAAFNTAAVIPAGWSRWTPADGRMLVGAGTVGEYTFTEAGSPGASWAHSHAATGLAVAVNPIGVQGEAGWLAAPGGAAGSTNVSVATHTHPAPAAAIGGSVQSTAWYPPVRVVVWAAKS